MKFWAHKVISRYFHDFQYRSVCEIGSSKGEATDILLKESNVHLTIIDPCFDTDLVAKYKNNSRVKVYKGLSLEVLLRLSEKFDSILIDGDHNWYSVFNELKVINERGLLADGGTIFFHDVGWPYGRRDMYYQPAMVPSEYRQPHARKGIVVGHSELSLSSGINGYLDNAEIEGGKRNGVLTAIEDFLAEPMNDYLLFRFEEEFGLGVLVKTKGLKPTQALVKWRLRSLKENMTVQIKKFVRCRFPAAFRLIKNVIRKK
jgi:hypothetical protein